MAQARDAVLREVGTLAARATEGAYIRELNPEASIARQLAFVQFDGLPPGSFATLASLLSEEFGIPENEFISYRHSAYGGGKTLFSNIPQSLVGRARLLGAEQALKDFEDLFAGASYLFHDVMALWGVNPANTIHVTPDIFLGPLKEVPSSQPRDILMGIPTHRDVREEAWGLRLTPKPRAALWTESRLTPLVGKGEDLCPPGRAAEMEDIARCITLFSETPVFQILHWAQTPCDTPLVPGAGGGGGQALTHDHQFDVPETTLAESEVSAAVAQFFALDEHHQRSFRIAMDRLNNSKSGIRRLEDQLIDLSIAAESLLLTNSDMSGQSYKVSLRGALLHSTLIEDRRATFNSLGEMYNFRNQAVHGRSFRGADAPHVADVVLRAQSLIRSISLAFLARRGVPDWREAVLRQ